MPETRGVTILAYHWIDPDPGRRLRRWGVTPEAFEAQMNALRAGGHQVLSLDEALRVVRGERTCPPGSVALTFDDGYRALLDHAVPVLERLGFGATFFLVSDRVGASNAWDDRHGDRPRALMGWSEAAALAARGMEIGSHSRTHPVLTHLSEAQQEDEIRGSKETIEDRIGRPVRFFSYPHGVHDARSRDRVAAAGYAAACSTRCGSNRAGVDRLLLRRTEIGYHDSAWTFRFKVRTGSGLRRWTAARVDDLVRRVAPATRGAAS